MKLINFSILYKPFAIFEEVVVQQAHRVSAITAEFPLGNSTRFAKLGASVESTRALSRY